MPLSSGWSLSLSPGRCYSVVEGAETGAASATADGACDAMPNARSERHACLCLRISQATFEPLAPLPRPRPRSRRRCAPRAAPRLHTMERAQLLRLVAHRSWPGRRSIFPVERRRALLLLLHTYTRSRYLCTYDTLAAIGWTLSPTMAFVAGSRPHPPLSTISRTSPPRLPPTKGLYALAAETRPAVTVVTTPRR